MKKTLSEEWRAWVVENLLGGVTETELVRRLVERGVSATLARREVRALARSPALPVCARLARRARRLELALALARAHAHGEPSATTIERRRTPKGEEFFRRYWAAHRPVVLTDATRGWPALRWTPVMFRDRFGDERIEVTTGRESDPHYDANFPQHRTRMKMARFIELVLAAGTTNDLYMVSNNRTMRRKAFRALLDEVRPPPELLQPPTPGGTSLWIGPAGTVTPLHHDTTNILFCQLHGRKRVELISPNETALLADNLQGFYSSVDVDALPRARHPALQRMLVKSVVLKPGDSLYIPAGWWHRVTALDVSISFSLLGFRRPNDFDWYRPGLVP
jgi:hypothetical protein